MVGAKDQQTPDHRKIGRDLDLFVFSDLVGPGLPLWTPRGTILRSQLDNFVQEMRDEIGFLAVTTPHLTKKDLYQKSGHWAKFKDDLFHVKSREGHDFSLKPMNCPHHSQIYAAKPRSYKELPIRYRETAMDYRDEQTGELNGLVRTRAFTQDDAHVFCRDSQVVDEILKLWPIIQNFYGAFDFPLTLRLSTRDPKTPEAYAGDPKLWQKAESELREVLVRQKDMKVEEEGVGDAAFYGPKLDFMAEDSLGRQWQVATLQVDFAQPEGLDLTYVNEKGAIERPVMIHCAVMGSIERFLAILIEHTQGAFPLWLSPEQLRIVTLNNDDNILQFAKNVVKNANSQGIRAQLDAANESISKKIQQAEILKVPYVAVIGDKEVESGELELRHRSDLPAVAKAKDDAVLSGLAASSKSRK